ncbi:MFS transporter [Williamsia sp.]|uniref:MFS transporter n=1 Tax=Williamsia sp. TaxID=1872085 RepID=UPI001A2193D9|nr:MFS transporter [Williamsia sp.]MBJ7289696.1 MFS transporter [Williamsia sp.]
MTQRTTPESTDVNQSLTLTVVCIGFAMVIVDTTIVNVALPAIRDDFGSDLSTLQWVVDGYIMVLAALLLSGGAMVDRLGAARMFRVGVALFTIASVLCGFAPDSMVLISARLVQGVAAALLMPAAMALLTQAYPEPASKARAVALFTTVAGSPQAFGPVLGGLLVSTIGWRSIFFLNIPVGTVTLLLASRGGLPRPALRADRGTDVAGQVLAVLALISVTGALIEAGEKGITSVVPITAAVSAIVFTIALVLRERSARSPLLPAKLLGAPGLSAYVVVGLLLFGAYYGLVFALSLYLQQVHHLSAFATGLQFLPSALPIFLLPVIAGRLANRWGPQRVVITGLATAAVGALSLLAVGSSSSPLMLSISLFLLGCGVGLTVGPQITLVINAAPPQYAGIASGLLNAGRQTGSVLGVAVLGALAGASDRVAGLHGAVVTAAVILAVAVLLGGLSRRSRSDEKPHRSEPANAGRADDTTRVS